MFDLIMQALPLSLLQLVFAVAMFNVAKKLGANRWLWAILIAIPLFGALAFWCLVLRALYVMADRICATTPALQRDAR